MKQEEKNFNKIEKIILYMIQIVNLKLLCMFHIKFKVFSKFTWKPNPVKNHNQILKHVYPKSCTC